MVDAILTFCVQVFLSELEDRQRVSRLYIDSIGDVIKTHMRGLDVYRVYCVNQRNAANILADLKSSDPALKATVDVRLKFQPLCLIFRRVLTPAQRVASASQEHGSGAFTSRTNAATYTLPAPHQPCAHFRCA